MSLIKQDGELLFPSVIWNQPVNKKVAGKILLIGGHAMKFSLTQTAYVSALKHGAGSVKVALPKSLRKILGDMDDCEFLPDTPSGSLARESLDDLIKFANDTDLVVFAGEHSSNDETVGVIESLIHETTTDIVLTSEAIKLLLHSPEAISKAKLLIDDAIGFSNFAKTLKIPIYTKGKDLQKAIKLLEALEDKLQNSLVLKDGRNILVRSDNKTSLTKVENIQDAQLYAACSVFYMQHTNKFEALTTAAYQLKSK